ncbi:MAG: Rrf2 family transcriptional regulator [Ruminococcaceae bacterium]|nr:Rrf2 family transcriptional regulator [Oscillospiraceae bacterium]
MHFALETDYAVRMIAVLADNTEDGNESMGAAAIGEAACIPKPTALKVLRMLKDKGLIHSTIGVNGGYRLAKAPGEITLASVIEAIEGRIEISRCLSDTYDCSRTGRDHCVCKFHNLYKGINERLVTELSRVTFEGKNL